MDPIEIPEDIASLESEDLASLAERITDRINELSENISPEGVAEMERLGETFGRINDVMVEREAADAALAERAANARRTVLGDAADADPADPTLSDVPGEGETVPAEPAPAADPADPEGEGEGDEDEQTPAGAVPAPAPAPAAVPIAAAAERPRSSTLASRLKARAKATAPATQPKAPAAAAAGQIPQGPIATATLTATAFTPDHQAGAEITFEQLAEAITKKRLRMGNVPMGVHDDKIYMGRAEMPYDQIGRKLDANPVNNFAMVRGVLEETALVASGGGCAPFAPRYDIYRLARPQSPVEDGLPVLGADRGGIRWVTPPDFREARAGVGVTTYDEDAAGYGSGSGEADFKPCVHLDCPDVQDANVTAVSHCIEFGNLQYMVFPEWVEARIMDMMVGFVSVKEVLYLDVIDDESTLATTGPTDGYGAGRRILGDAIRAAVNYRRRNSMDENASLDWYVPGWVPWMIKADFINDAFFGLQIGLDTTFDQISATLQRATGLNAYWYYDSATGEGQAFSDLQVDGDPLNDWPEDIVTYLHAPGTFVRLDGGQLDVGLIRDSVLNRTNDLQIFAEQWVNAAMLGIEGIKIRHEGVCPNGAAPAGTELILCGS